MMPFLYRRRQWQWIKLWIYDNIFLFFFNISQIIIIWNYLLAVFFDNEEINISKELTIFSKLFIFVYVYLDVIFTFNHVNRTSLMTKLIFQQLNCRYISNPNINVHLYPLLVYHQTCMNHRFIIKKMSMNAFWLISFYEVGGKRTKKETVEEN
jgi:hypothetical protein